MDDCWQYHYFEKKFETIERLLVELKTQGENTMAQIDDLNTAIQAEDVQVTTLATSITKIDADVDALLLAAQKAGVPTDLTLQIQAIQSHTSALATAVAQLAADDTKANKPA